MNRANAENQKIVNLRALAIILVVFGHSIILYSKAWNLYQTSVECVVLDFIKRCIDIVQMPLFISISGYLFCHSVKNNSFSLFCEKKIKRVIVPFLFVSLCWLLPIRYILNYPGYVGMNIMDVILNKILWGRDNGHLWFLQAIFFIFVISYPLVKICERFHISVLDFIILLCSCILAIKADFFWEIPILCNVLKYLFWFLLGYLIDKYEKNPFKNTHNMILKLVLISLCMVGFAKIKMVLALVVICLCYGIMPNRSTVLLKEIARTSFGIYLFHSPFIYFTFTYFLNANPFIVVGINFVFFGLISYLMTVVILKSRFKYLIGS